MGNSQWEREWNGLHNWESRAHRLHEVIGTQHNTVAGRRQFDNSQECIAYANENTPEQMLNSRLCAQ